MTTNKPKVLAYHINKENPAHKGVTLEPLIRLSDYEELQAECEKLRMDADRYRWLRMADWWDSPLCVVRNPAKQVKLGTDCPSRDRLDATIDAAIAKATTGEVQ